MLIDWSPMLKFIQSLGTIELRKNNFIFGNDIDKTSILKVLMKNLNTSEVIGISADNKRRIYVQKYLFKDVEQFHADTLNLIKLADLIVNDNFSEDTLLNLSDILKDEAFSLIGKYFPQHRKSLLKFRITKSNNINTLMVCFNEDSQEFELLYNPIKYVKLVIKEVLILTMKYSVSEVKHQDFLFIAYGAFMFLHELYHILYRHCTDNYLNSDFPHDFENIIMDNYININILYHRFNTLPEVQSFLKQFKIPSLEINTGVGITVDVTSKLNFELIKADKIQIDNILKSFEEYSTYGFDVLQQFLSRCTVEDMFFVSLKSYQFDRAYDSFSFPIRQFMKEFLQLNEAVPETKELYDNQDNSYSNDLSENNMESSSGENSEDTEDESECSDSDDFQTSNIPFLLKNDLSELDDVSEDMLNALLVPFAQEVQEMNEQQNIDTDSQVQSLLENIDFTVKNKIKEDWRDRLTEIIEESQGIHFLYNPDGQNRRYEGQLGRFELVPAIESVVFAFDVSYSMSVKDFQAVINYLDSFLTDIFSGNIQTDTTLTIGYIFFAGTYQGTEFTVMPKSLESIDSVFRDVSAYESKARYTVGQGTDFSAIIRPFLIGDYKNISFDLLIVFTDGQFLNDDISLSYRNWYNENKDKIIFILTTDKYLNCLYNNDINCRDRVIIYHDVLI